jgi:hypothetical protein
MYTQKSPSYVCQGRLVGNQTINTNTDTILTFQNNGTNCFDTQDWWNNSSHKYQPTIAGYYNLHLNVWFNSGSSNSNQTNIQIRKTSSSTTNTIAISQAPISTTTGYTLSCNCCTYLNGTTDYITFSAYSSNPTSHTIIGNNNSEGTYFTAFNI